MRRVTIKIKGHGQFTVPADGIARNASIVEILTKAEPSRQVLGALTAIVGGLRPTESRTKALCYLIAEQLPTKELVCSLARHVNGEKPQIQSLIEGQQATKSTLKILASLVA